MHFVSLIESTASPVNATSASQPISRRACITITQEGPPTHLRRLVTCLAVSNRTKAEAFERHVKSGSGHAFARRRLW